MTKVSLRLTPVQADLDKTGPGRPITILLAAGRLSARPGQRLVRSVGLGKQLLLYLFQRIDLPAPHFCAGATDDFQKRRIGAQRFHKPRKNLNIRDGITPICHRFFPARLTPQGDWTRILPIIVSIEESTPARFSVREIREVYSRLAPLYGLWQRFAQGRSLRAALELADVQKDERVLEVAVGPGTALESLALRNPGGITIGLDLTPAMLERARRRLQEKPGVRRQKSGGRRDSGNPNFECRVANHEIDRSLPRAARMPALFQGDARSLPFADASFDLVFASYVLDLLAVADIATALGEMRRVLQPSGKLVLIYLRQGNRRFDRVWNALYWLAPVLLGGSRPIRVAESLPSAGFSVIESRRIVERGIPAEVVLARRR